jgi:hypothetical protein
LQQIGEKQSPNVPWKFLQDLTASKPFTSAALLNDLLADGGPQFVRTLDGKCRAFLSSRYRVLDNFDLAFASLQAVQAVGGNVIECSLTDKKMHMTFTCQSIWDRLAAARDNGGSVNVGQLANRAHFERFVGNAGERNWAGRNVNDLPGGSETVFPIVRVSNSETGHGGFSIRVGMLQGICMNGMISDVELDKVHLGGVMNAGLWTDETHAADSKAIFLKARDTIAAGFDQEKFSALVARARKAGSVQIEDATAAVDQVVASLKMPESAKSSILEYFLSDYQRTALGLGQAVSRYAQDLPEADAADEMETWAGAIIAKPALCTV